MIIKISALLFVIMLTKTLFAQSSNKPLETVKYVDLNKYAGTWYEIAKIPNRFQKKCTGNTTAQYELTHDGKVLVINSCDGSDKDRIVVNGVAKVVDEATNAKLEVSFFKILGIRPIWGDYWIIGLDENYEYAIVGSPDRKYGWILSRKPVLAKNELNEAFAILKSKGYDPSKFVFTPQNE